MQSIKVFAQSCARVCLPGGYRELHAMLKANPVHGLHRRRIGTMQPNGHHDGSLEDRQGFLKV